MNVVSLALEIVDHGCERCGNSPVGDTHRKLVFTVLESSCVRHGLCPDLKARTGNMTIAEYVNFAHLDLP